MNRWAVALLLLAVALKLFSGAILEASHGMHMMESCDGGVTCQITSDECLKHCITVGSSFDAVIAQLPTLPAVGVSIFVGALAVLLIRKLSPRVTILAPPTLRFVETTILRE